MTPRSKTGAAVLAGAVVLASGAYAIGSQSGGGTSGAATDTAAAAHPGDPAASLAGRLGVTEAQLRAAFEAIRKSNPPPGLARFEQALAGALGLPESRVADALAKLRGQHEAAESARRAAFAKSLASELGLDASKVTAALDKLHPGGPNGPHPGGPGFGPPAGGPGFAGPPPGGPGGPPGRFRGRFGLRDGRDRFLGALASELGVDTSKLRAALEKLRPDGPNGDVRRDGPPAGFVDDLAKELGVKSSDVQSALEKIRSHVEADMQARRDKLAQALADRLNLPVQKVKDALAAEPHGPGPHP